MHFDSLGNLYPYDVIPLSEDKFFHEFIKNGNLQVNRIKQWDNYQKFITILKKLIKADFHIWIYGSLVTLDRFKETSDIDVMVFIPKLIYDRLDKEGAVNYYFSTSKDSFNIDSYYGWIIEANSDFYEKDWAEITKQKKLKFCSTYGGLPRGCIQINYH